MQIARFYIKGYDVTPDLPIPVGGNIAALMAAVRADGFVVAPGFYIPYDQIAFVLAYEAEQEPAKVFHIVPNPDKPL